MAIRGIVITLFILVFLSCAVDASVIDFYGKQYINFEIGELLTVIVADTIQLDLPDTIQVEGLMGVSSLSYLVTQDGKIDFLLTAAPEVARDFMAAKGYLYAESSRLLLKDIPPIHMTVGADRVTLVLQIPVNLIEDKGKYFLQIYVPQEENLELFVAWPILVGE